MKQIKNYFRNIEKDFKYLYMGIIVLIGINLGIAIKIYLDTSLVESEVSMKQLRDYVQVKSNFSPLFTDCNNNTVKSSNNKAVVYCQTPKQVFEADLPKKIKCNYILHNNYWYILKQDQTVCSKSDAEDEIESIIQNINLHTKNSIFIRDSWR